MRLITTVLLLVFVVVTTGCMSRSATDPPGNNPGPQPQPQPEPQPEPQPQPQPEPEPQPEPLAAGKHTLQLEMADGINLSTDVYIPDGEGPWPVLMVRTPYDKQWEQTYAEEVNLDGFVYVAQDMRGRYESEGWNVPLIGEDLGEHNDGYQTFEWVSSQPWCNGRIGTLGGSALGMTQLFSAPGNPPGLACQFIGVAPASMFHEFVYPGGAYRQEQMEIWVDVNNFSQDSLDLYREHDTYNEWWHQFDVNGTEGRVRVPGMHFGGWFDTFSEGTINTWRKRQYHGGPGAKGRQWLVMGPWTHGDVGKLECGEMIFPEAAAAVPGNPYQSYMDFYLKYKGNGFEERPAVSYYVMGDVDDPQAPGNVWRVVDHWPPPSAAVRYYLHADGSLKLSLPREDTGSAWAFDPADPVPTIGGRNLMIDKGVYDQRTIEEREDVLVFETAILAEPVEVTGRVKCRFWVSTDALDTDIAVRLCDVYPDGRSMQMLDGIQRLRYRDSMEQTTLATPGMIYEIEVDLWSMSLVFNAGHRIRISVCGGNHPRYDINPGTGGIYEEGGAYVVQATTLHHGETIPSQLILPVVE